jgi:hypothetical protein
MFKSRLLGLLLVSSVAVLGACGGGDSFDDRADIADPVVRFVHAAPGAPDVTLQRNGVNELYAVGVPYKSASQYQDVDTERYTFTLRAATGGTTDLASTVVEAQRGKKQRLRDAGRQLRQNVVTFSHQMFLHPHEVSEESVSQPGPGRNRRA